MEPLVFDDQLFNEVRANAGRDVHDVYSATCTYKHSVEIHNNKLEKGEDPSHFKFMAMKYERICRSFLITKDLEKSKEIVVESLKSLET